MSDCKQCQNADADNEHICQIEHAQTRTNILRDYRRPDSGYIGYHMSYYAPELGCPNFVSICPGRQGGGDMSEHVFTKEALLARVDKWLASYPDDVEFDISAAPLGFFVSPERDPGGVPA